MNKENGKFVLQAPGGYKYFVIDEPQPTNRGIFHNFIYREKCALKRQLHIIIEFNNVEHVFKSKTLQIPLRRSLCRVPTFRVPFLIGKICLEWKHLSRPIKVFCWASTRTKQNWNLKILVNFYDRRKFFKFWNVFSLTTIFIFLRHENWSRNSLWENCIFGATRWSASDPEKDQGHWKQNSHWFDNSRHSWKSVCESDYPGRSSECFYQVTYLWQWKYLMI